MSTGWLRVFPGPALVAFSNIWCLANSDGGPVPGDLDDLDVTALGADQDGGLDTPYDPAKDEDPEEEQATWEIRWKEWQEYAAQRGRPMSTYRDVLEFMAEVGLLERRASGGQVYWGTTAPVPLAEDVLPLSAERREAEAKLRWRNTFQPAANAIVGWLVGQRAGDDLMLEVTTSINEMAVELDLDLENARHGLACAVSEASDMWATPDPESALLTDPVRITVDWQRFDAERIALRLTLPEDS